MATKKKVTAKDKTKELDELKAQLDEAKAEKAAKEQRLEDVESGVEFDEDFDYENYDPNHPELHLKRVGEKYEPEKFVYRKLNRANSNNLYHKTFLGWKIIPGTELGDTVWARMTHAQKAKSIDVRIKRRQEAFDAVGNELDNIAHKGVKVFEGHGSREQGMK